MRRTTNGACSARVFLLDGRHGPEIHYAFHELENDCYPEELVFGSLDEAGEALEEFLNAPSRHQ